MEFDLIPQVIIIFSIGTVIFILGRNIPKIKEMKDDDLLFENENRKEKKKFSYLCSRLTRRIKRDNRQERMGSVWKWLEKSLRKIRIKFLRLDNKIVSILEKLKKKHTKCEDNGSEIKIEEKTRDEYKDFDESKNSVVDNVELEKSEKSSFKFSDLNDSVKENSFANKFEDEVVEKREDNEEEDGKEENKDEVKLETESEEKPDKDESVAETEIKAKDKKISKEKEYINLILKSPKNIKAYWKLGIVYSRKKKYKDSISCFRQIVKIDPSYTKAKRKIVDLMRRMKKDKKEDKENKEK